MDLFEFDEPEELPLDFDIDNFKNFLNDTWTKYQNEKSNEYFYDYLDDRRLYTKQRFFNIDNNKIQSRNYVGLIKFGNNSFNLYPKICKNKDRQDITSMLLFWLKYSNICTLPKIETSLKNCEYDFFEILILIYAKYTQNLFSTSLFQHYEEISEETTFLKGRLDFNEYIRNICSGKPHLFHCTFDSFELNNKFNQIVKYVSKRLLEVTSNDYNKRLLNDIICALNDVDYVNCSLEDCNQVYINRFMEDFVIVLEYCKLFLSHCISFNTDGENQSFAFLIRTEALFEDFISNFIKLNYGNKDVKIGLQTVHNLDKGNYFRIKPDIIIKQNGIVSKIFDVKYKIIGKTEDISQGDIYQCLAYANRLQCDNVTLLYPKTENRNCIEQIEIDSISINFKFIPTDNKKELKEFLDGIILQNQTNLSQGFQELRQV